MASAKSTEAKAQDTKAASPAKHAAGEGKKAAQASKPAAKKKDAKKGGKPGLVTRAKSYVKAVRQELKRVVWPTRPELVKYSVAVVAMLVFFGVLIAIVDACIVPALYAFSGLR
jgi:preprotein translocase subunit SecE